jgi:hypothetical protein
LETWRIQGPFFKSASMITDFFVLRSLKDLEKKVIIKKKTNKKDFLNEYPSYVGTYKYRG